MKPFGIALCMLLAGCGSSAASLTNQELAAGQQLDAAQSAAVDQVREACPGLAGYFPDIRITEVRVPGYNGDSTVVFDVADRAREELSNMMVEGERCYIDTSGGVSSTGKRACVSVCRQREFMGSDGPPYRLD